MGDNELVKLVSDDSAMLVHRDCQLVKSSFDVQPSSNIGL
jgi:hypothetical protein